MSKKTTNPTENLKTMYEFTEVDAGWWENESGQFGIADPRAGYYYNPDDGQNQEMKSNTPTGKFELYIFPVSYNQEFKAWEQGKLKKLVGLYATIEATRKVVEKLLKAGESFGSINRFDQVKYKQIAGKYNWGKHLKYGGKGSEKDWK